MTEYEVPGPAGYDYRKFKICPLKMERLELEEAVFNRLQINTPLHAEMLRKAISLKPTEELEDILKRMKEVGR